MGHEDVSLEDAVAVVTGASSGIGAATARALAAEGARVVLAARRAERLSALTGEIEAAGGAAISVPTDARDTEASKKLVDEALSAFGKVDILVNSAGVGYWDAVADADIEKWREEMEVNLLGLMATTRLVLPTMFEQGSGDIVNVSSLSGRSPGPEEPGYTATKWGLTGFTESIRRDLRKKRIRVTLIEPGAVATEMQSEEDIASMRMLEADDVADAIVYAVTRPPHVCIGDVQIYPLPDEVT